IRAKGRKQRSDTSSKWLIKMLGEFGQRLQSKERCVSHLIAAALRFTRERGTDKEVRGKAVLPFFAFANRDQLSGSDAKFFLRFTLRCFFRGLPFHTIAAGAAKQAAPSIGQPRSDKDLAIRDNDHADGKGRTAGRIASVRVAIIVLAVFFVA